MKIGTKSLLYGAHCFFIHPFFIARAWIQLYGWSWDPRLWLAFLVHDWGYWGKPNMDGPEGESHVYWAGYLFANWFGERWGEFVFAHSRFWCQKEGGIPISRLCTADKLAIAITPDWLYMRMIRWTGEVDEYMAIQKHQDDLGFSGHDQSVWRQALIVRMCQFVQDNQRIAANNDWLLERGPKIKHGKMGDQNPTPNFG